MKAEEEQCSRDEEQAQREAEGRKRRGQGPAPIDPTPADKAPTNFTDPKSKIMKQSNKGFDYSYNAQAVVDSEDQIIVAAETTNAANDKEQAVPMAQAALNNLDAAGIERPKGADGTRRRFRTRRIPATSAKKRSKGWRRSASTRTSPLVAKSTMKLRWRTSRQHLRLKRV